MAETPSTMVSLGTQAPHFSLPDTEGNTVTLDGFKGAPALLVAFICNHCPFVKHVRAGFADMTKNFLAQGVAVVAINSNDADAFPADSPEAMKTERVEAGYSFPYLF